jgi:hypothetical protein
MPDQSHIRSTPFSANELFEHAPGGRPPVRREPSAVQIHRGSGLSDLHSKTLLQPPKRGFASMTAHRSRELIKGGEQVVCEEKHMGSRAVVIVCRDAESAQTRFGTAVP